MPNTVQCPSGHYFDLNKFRFCPFCGAPAVMPPVPPQSEQVPYGQPVPSPVYGQPPIAPSGQASYGQPTPPPIYGQPPMALSEQPAYGQPTVYGQPPISQPKPSTYGQPTQSSVPVQPEQSSPLAAPVVKTAVSDDEKNTRPTVGWLVGVEGPCAGQTYPLREERTFIGRAAAMDIVLSDDPQVALNAHAIVVYVPKSKTFYAQPGYARALYELNGTVVLETVPLSADDQLTIGTSVFRFVPLCGEVFDWASVGGNVPAANG